MAENKLSQWLAESDITVPPGTEEAALDYVEGSAAKPQFAVSAVKQQQLLFTHLII